MNLHGSNVRPLLPPAAALVPGAVAVALCLVPGFDVLDYHACLALAPVVGLCAGHLAISTLSGRLPRSRATLAALALLSLPLLVLIGAMAFTPNCNPLYGLGFYALGPFFSALVGAGLATLAWLLLPGAGATTLGLFYALVLLSVVPPLGHFYAAPQVFAYHGLTGYIAGALYEDAVQISRPYLMFRLLDLALWLPVLALGRIVADSPLPRRRAWGSAVQRPLVRVALAAVLTAAALSWVLAGPERWRIATADVKDALPVRVEVPSAEGGTALVLHMPADARLQGDRTRAVEDASFRFRSLQRFFGATPGTIEVFLYPDAATKRRWMGANRVDMAKPWLRQVHMILPEFGASVLTHELAHVFASRFGAAPFGVPLRHGIMPDAVLIEGMAVAAEWPHPGGLDPHQWTRAMRALHLAPRLEALFSTSGFFSQSSDRAYTLAGSFLRWLIETRGMAVAQRLYHSADIEEATGQPLAALVPAWEAYVDDAARHPLSADDRERAQARFEKPGLFHRPCALEIGRCTERAEGLWRRAKDREASVVWRTLMDRLHGAVAGSLEPELNLGWADALARIADRPAARRLVDTVLAETSLNRLQRAQALIVRGDLALQSTDVAAALADWDAAARLPLGHAALRTLEVKRHLAVLPAGLPIVQRLFASGAPYTEIEPVLAELRATLPGDPVARYLLGRFDVLHGPGQSGAETLRAVLPELTTAELRAETLRLVALDLARQGAVEDLARWSQQDAPHDWLAEMTRRCQWAAELRQTPAAR